MNGDDLDDTDTLTRWATTHARTVGHSGVGAGTVRDVKADVPVAAPDLATFRLERTLSGHTWRVWATALTEHLDGRLLLATGSEDGTARIWDFDTGACLRTLTDHTGWVWSVAWAGGPEGRLLLATGSDDDRVYLWATDLPLVAPAKPARGRPAETTAPLSELSFRAERTLSGPYPIL